MLFCHSDGRQSFVVQQFHASACVALPFSKFHGPFSFRLLVCVFRPFSVRLASVYRSPKMKHKWYGNFLMTPTVRTSYVRTYRYLHAVLARCRTKHAKAAPEITGSYSYVTALRFHCRMLSLWNALAHIHQPDKLVAFLLSANCQPTPKCHHA